MTFLSSQFLSKNNISRKRPIYYHHLKWDAFVLYKTTTTMLLYYNMLQTKRHARLQITAKTQHFMAKMQKKILGRGHSPSTYLSPNGEGDTPSPYPTPSAPHSERTPSPVRKLGWANRQKITLGLHCRIVVGPSYVLTLFGLTLDSAIAQRRANPTPTCTPT